MSKTLRILYTAGPGDVIGTYSHWVEKRDDPSQVAMTYSGQFYEVCRALDAQAYVIGSCGKKNFLRDGRFTIEHRPIPLRCSSKLLNHLGQLWYGLGLQEQFYDVSRSWGAALQSVLVRIQEGREQKKTSVVEQAVSQ